MEVASDFRRVFIGPVRAQKSGKKTFTPINARFISINSETDEMMLQFLRPETGEVAFVIGRNRAPVQTIALPICRTHRRRHSALRNEVATCGVEIHIVGT
jgi:hypothetical protein